MKQWDANAWLNQFKHAGADYRSLRREVWQNTLDIVQQGGYTFTDGTCVRVGKGWEMIRHSRMYHEPIQPKLKKSEHDTRITVSLSDCMDVAHEWVQSGKEVSVLNMANRQNPGGGVLIGAGAQEEYLFRCTNYYRSMFRYVDYACQYGLTRSHWSYPLDKNHGGIYTPGVTVFRANEQQGYALLDEPWRVNMIAVAGMNNPRLVDEGGETRIAPELVEGVKNKIRTIFRIATDNHQGNLVLGALGCGTFHNPPRHVAELFKDVLCEKEFEGAFENICFAVKADHNSRGDSNYIAFRDVLDGFNPTEAKLEDRSMIPIRKVTLAASGIMANHPDLPVVSLDDLRLELDVDASKNQGRVVQAAKERAKALLRDKQPFIWNATSLTVRRAQQVDLFERYHARVRLIYLETAWEENLRRNANRTDAVPEGVVYDMLDKLEPPERYEAQTVEWLCV